RHWHPCWGSFLWRRRGDGTSVALVPYQWKALARTTLTPALFERLSVHAQLSPVDLSTKFELVTNLTTEAFKVIGNLVQEVRIGPVNGCGHNRSQGRTGRDPSIGGRSKGLERGTPGIATPLYRT